MRGCPDAATLAAYLDGSLFPEERQRLEEHLARCATCALVVADGLAFLERDAPVVQGLPRSRGVLAAAAAMLVALLAAGGWWTLHAGADARRAREARAEIFRALDGERNILPRLSGGMPWAAPAETTRGAPSVAEPSSWRLAAAAERARELADVSPTAPLLDTLASAQLLLGDADDGIATLRRAAAASPRDARVHSDLAAAYVARAGTPGGAHALALAIEEAGIALDLDPDLLEARFNQALALEGMHLTLGARAAWRDVVARETDPGWLAEARRHLASLPPPQLEAHGPEFTDSVLATERAEAPAALADAYDDLARGEAARGGMNVERAAPLLERAAVRLPAGSAGRRRARLELLASAYYTNGDSPALLESLATLRDEAAQASDDYAVACVDQLRGVMAVRRGAASEALDDYLRALAGFDRVGDGATAAWLRYLTSEAYTLLGDPLNSWARRREALGSLGELRDADRAYDLLGTSSELSILEGMPHTAAALLDELPAVGGPVAADSRAWVAIGRARVLARLGRPEETRTALATATRLLALVDSANARHGLGIELQMTRGLASDDPIVATAAFGHAIAGMQRYAQWQVPYALLERARAERRAGSPDRAEADLRAGIALAERQRDEAGRQALWMGARADLTALYDEQVDLALARGERDAAFLAAERGRARVLRSIATSREPLPPVPPPAALAASLPEDTGLIAFALDGDTAVVWSLQRRRGAVMARSPLAANRLDALLAGLRADLAAGAWTDRTRDSARELYDALIAPARLDPGVKRLALVADGDLATVPFAALVAPDGHFLVESRSLVVTPSVASFLSQSARPAAGGPVEHALIFGDARPDARLFPGYPALEGSLAEARRIASLYPQPDLALGAAATDRRLLAALPAGGVVHIGAHLLLNRAQPARSALLLSPAASDSTGGAVYADQIASLHLERTRVIVLAGCDSADGPVAGHEGPLSVARAFLAAGAPNVIATLWPIADRRSVAPLTALHSTLRNGVDPADALRTAQLSMIASPDRRLRSPATWAAFQALGG